MSKPLAFLLLLFAIAGGIAIHGSPFRNGTSEMIQVARVHNLLADGTRNPYRGKITGIGGVDFMLFTLVNVFWPVSQGERTELSLLGVLFGGQIVALLTMTMIEGFREGNKGRIVAFISVYAFLFQTAGFAILSPLYLCLYVLTSPIFATPTAANLIVSNVDAIPFGILFGYLPVSILVALPYPSVLSLKQKIWAVMLWQPTPHYAIYISKILSSLSPHKSKTSSIPRQLMHLRAAYKFALLFAVPAHLYVWTLSLTSILWPSLFSSQAQESLRPLNALIPRNLINSLNAEASNISEGSLWLLQWNYWIGSLSYLLFAMAAKSYATKKMGAKEVVAALGRTMAMGPLAAALTLLWDRDEVVFETAEKLGKKES
ncbi:hypothetical protein E2P81_ATG09234 [Venturia nashicola]|uniref:Uncharacterized protein n=1 Tax=Venturia nashicola TaxID=86259 RepID=A0A4Z1P3F8_9PEZI|nr:hypothetical protein E6O75_ATG09437 [Venturia nashicola]TLD20164.1 hypothetical protein E2P81_ATG09234 [Venturia nashicola]